MDVTTVVELVKERIGIRSKVRDSYLTAIVNGVINELEDEKGILLGIDNPNHLMFVVDYTTWRYQSRDSMSGMPRHLQYRLHNLFVSAGGKSDI